MRKPNAILHMTSYGLIYGLLLGMLFVWFILMNANRVDGTMPWDVLLQAVLGTANLAFVFGALPGAVMGFIEGWILWFLTRNVQLPIIESEIATRRNVVFGVMGGLTFLGMYALISLLSGGYVGLLTIMPPVIAAFAAIYAVHRYFLKLRAWGNVGKVKNKAKHSLTNQLAYEDAAEDDGFMLSQDVAHQQMQDKQ